MKIDRTLYDEHGFLLPGQDDPFADALLKLTKGKGEKIDTLLPYEKTAKPHDKETRRSTRNRTLRSKL